MSWLVALLLVQSPSATSVSMSASRPAATARVVARVVAPVRIRGERVQAASRVQLRSRAGLRLIEFQ